MSSINPQLETRLSNTASSRPKRILSLDGGGVRGILSIGILKQLETVLAKKHRPDDPDSFRLSDYFDLIGGTSTGSIISAMLALGKSVDEIKDSYLSLAEKVFPSTRRQGIMKPKYDRKGIDSQLTSIFGDIELQSDDWKSGLAIFAKRMDTGSPWILSNHPKSKFWDEYYNKEYLIRDIVRSSTAAPYFFDPHEFDVMGRNGKIRESGIFVDGAVGGMNNPCMELLVLASQKDYPFQWETGADSLFMLSIGTGTWRERHSIKGFLKLNNVWKAYHAMMGIIQDSGVLSLKHIQALSCPPQNAPQFNEFINSEIDNMPSMAMTPHPLLTFRRLNASLEQEDLRNSILSNLKERQIEKAVSEMRQIDNAREHNLLRLFKVGEQAGDKLLHENVEKTLCAYC